MYAHTQTRAYAPHTSGHYHSVSMSASYPYSSHRSSDARAQNSVRAISPTVVRTRPRTGTSAAPPQFDPATFGQSARGSKQYNLNPANKSTAASKHEDPSPRRRAQSQSQPQPRSRSPHPQTEMYPYPYAYPQRASSSSQLQFQAGTNTGPNDPVVPNLEQVREEMRRRMEGSAAVPVSHGNYGPYAHPTHASRERGSGHSRAHAHGHGYLSSSVPHPFNNGPPPGYEDCQPVGPEGPVIPRSLQNLANRERSTYPPPRPPSPASHYPFFNYGKNNAHGEHGSQRRDPESQNIRSSTARDAHTHEQYQVGGAPSQADSTASDPLIHNALGWWPDLHRPALYWDLSSPTPPRYIKRPFDASELASPPFTPPLRKTRLVLDPQLQWAFEISAPRGERYITLQSLLHDIATLMRTPNRVPHSFWVRASARKKEEVLRTMLRRTGRGLNVPPPHRRPKTRGQIMEEAVVDGAPAGYTNLIVLDLLCGNVMFAGMEFHKEPDEWVLRTTPRY